MEGQLHAYKNEEGEEGGELVVDFDVAIVDLGFGVGGLRFGGLGCGFLSFGLFLVQKCGMHAVWSLGIWMSLHFGASLHLCFPVEGRLPKRGHMRHYNDEFGQVPAGQQASEYDVFPVHAGGAMVLYWVC